MDPQNLSEPSLNDLYCLSVLGNVAYAARCARRVQPYFLLPKSEEDADKMIAVVNTAIAWAEEFVRQGKGSLERAKVLTDVTWQVAEATYDYETYSAYAAHHAVRGAYMAAMSAEVPTEETIMEVVAAAFGACRALLSNVPQHLRAAVLRSLRADYEKLLTMSTAQTSRRGQCFDPTEKGPLGDWRQDSPPVP